MSLTVAMTLREERLKFINEKYGVTVDPQSAQSSVLIRGVTVTLTFLSLDLALVMGLQATLAASLDLGLSVSQESHAVDEARQFAVNDSNFASIFTRICTSGELILTQKILSATVRSNLLTLARAGIAGLCDYGVSCTLDSVALTGPELSTLIDAAVNIALELNTARAAMDVPLSLRSNGVAEALRHGASERGWTIQKRPFILAGSTNDAAISLKFHSQLHHGVPGDWSAIAPKSIGYEASVRFASSINIGLRMYRSTMMDRIKGAFGFGGLTLGDTTFDQAWAIHARDEQRAIQCLNGETRQLLQSLESVTTEVLVDDHGLTMRGPSIKTPSEVAVILQAIATLSTALHHAERSAPYR